MEYLDLVTLSPIQANVLRRKDSLTVKNGKGKILAVVDGQHLDTAKTVKITLSRESSDQPFEGVQFLCVETFDSEQ